MKHKDNVGRVKPWEKVILGQPQSKANSRRLVHVGGKPRFVKSKSALSYLADFNKQCPVLDPMFEGNVSVEMEIWYASRRPDLDESVILDALQGKVYRNDRQVREKHIYWRLDPDNPRTRIRIVPLEAE